MKLILMLILSLLFLNASSQSVLTGDIYKTDSVYYLKRGHKPIATVDPFTFTFIDSAITYVATNVTTRKKYRINMGNMKMDPIVFYNPVARDTMMYVAFQAKINSIPGEFSMMIYYSGKKEGQIYFVGFGDSDYGLGLKIRPKKLK